MADRLDPGVRKNLIQWGTTVSFTLGWFAGPPDWISQMGYGTAAMVLFALVALAAVFVIPRTANWGKGWILIVVLSLSIAAAQYAWMRRNLPPEESAAEVNAVMDTPPLQSAEESQGG